jgi:hypothetical protein
MSELESLAKPAIEPLLGDAAVTVDVSAQATLSAWAIKNAMVFEALRVEPPWVFSDSERTRLRQTLEPPATTSVWLAKCVGQADAYCSASDLFGQVDGTTEPMRAYVTTMVFGPLAMQVARVTLPVNAPQSLNVTADVRPGPWGRVTIRIGSPARESIQWPPAVGLAGETGIEAFAERWSPIAT